MMTLVPEAQSLSRRCQVLLYGDLSLVHFEDQLRCLLNVKINPLLTSFFDRVTMLFGGRLFEILPTEQQDLFPRFATLIDLLRNLGRQMALRS
jgi:naphtho-gamma-pyrone polyketide synthase